MAFSKLGRLRTGSLYCSRGLDSGDVRLAAITQLFQSLGRAGAPLAARLLQGLGQLCAGAAEAEDAGDATAPVAGPARAALGAAIRSLGPEAVLDALPLQLQEVYFALTSSALKAVLQVLFTNKCFGKCERLYSQLMTLFICVLNPLH